MGSVPPGLGRRGPRVGTWGTAQIVVLRPPSPDRGATPALAVRPNIFRSALSSLRDGPGGDGGQRGPSGSGTLHFPGPPMQSCSQTALSLPSRTSSFRGVLDAPPHSSWILRNSGSPTPRCTGGRCPVGHLSTGTWTRRCARRAELRLKAFPQSPHR